MSQTNDKCARALTPSSTTSGCVSSEGSVFEENLPSGLAEEELQLALNKEATADELEKAIDRCKELVVLDGQSATDRKWLVRHLIELRLRLQECKEAAIDPKHPRNKSSGVSNRSIRGHHLTLQPLLQGNSSRYCDHCTGTIWSVVQAWYKCEDCGYSCHHKCLSGIIRECAHITASEKGYEIDICPEEGLSAQKFLCAECKSVLQIGNSWNEARICDYTGLYYCTACHWGSSAIIPARIIHNWDFTPMSVCQASLQLLRLSANRPFLNVEKLNSKLFNLVQELNLVKRLRYELNGMRKYLLVCRKAEENHLLWKNVTVPHLIDSPDLYSLQDLLDTKSGELPSKLHAIMATFNQHIKVDCEICHGRGHICEICSNNEVLFPFELCAVTCEKCNAVLHNLCYNRKNGKCPKCTRIKKRAESTESLDEEDYPM